MSIKYSNTSSEFKLFTGKSEKKSKNHSKEKKNVIRDTQKRSSGTVVQGPFKIGMWN